MKTLRVLAIALALVSPALARAQEAAPPATASTPASSPERFDLATALSTGDEALTAERAAQLAIEHSPRIDVAELSATAAEASLRAATAALVPRLDLAARYAHVDGFPDGRISTGSADPAQLAAARALAGTIADTAARTIITGMLDQQAAASGGVTIHIPRDQYALTARLTVPVSDIVFAALPAMEGAEGRVRAERLRVEAVQNDVAFAAIEAFYRYVEARGVAAVAVSARDRAAALRDQIVRYADAGILGPADRASAEARVAQAEEAVARTEAAVQVSGAALSILLGTPAGRAWSVAAALPEEIPHLPGTLDAIETAAIDHRPELRAARESLAAQSRARDATIATGYPHLALYAYGEGSSPNQRVFPLRDEFIGTYELGATLTWSPNDTATALFRGDEMAAQIQAAADQMRLAEDGIRLEVRQAFEELRASERSVEAARASAEAAEEAYRAQTAALAAGESILNDLLLADSRATDARLADLRARLAASLARARLAHAIGERSTAE